MEFKSGDRLCSCTLVEKCGHGAYGDVWLAEDSIGARVALKIIGNRGSYSERELNGLKNYKNCNHPNLLKIRYVEITDERICCMMDAADDLNRGNGKYLPDTLANRLNKFGRMDGKEITAMLDGLLSGLEELHKNGLVHRDIKPDNILWVNGRPTLADVGLIALDGKGSLVGTPGFMSPKLMSGKGPADASDDFYALGKVIYCALTGLPVGEYPSIPQNMTISMDASLGRAFRESCKHPVRSSAEFRKLMQGKPVPPRRQQVTTSRPWKILWLLILLALLLVAGSLLMLPSLTRTPIPDEAPGRRGQSVRSVPPREVNPVRSVPPREVNPVRSVPPREVNPVRSVPPREVKPVRNVPPKKRETLGNAPAAQKTKKQKVVFSPEDEAQLKALETVDADAQKDLQDRIIKFFREVELLPGKGDLTPVLLEYDVMTRKEILDQLLHSNRNPRLTPTAGVLPRTVKPTTVMERELYYLIFSNYPDIDRKTLKARQDFWRKKLFKTPAQLQREMLETDPLMQAAALDCVIRNGINDLLSAGKMTPDDKIFLRDMLYLRRELLDPKWNKVVFMGRKFRRQK